LEDGCSIVIGLWPVPLAPGHAPYFHKGSAANLREVVDFYDRRFEIGFTLEQNDDLVAFLSTL
jgi:cytochrome c peroxidase